MLRRLWVALTGPSLRRDRGAQHTEAGVLIAALALMGGAMVAAAPAIGDATASFWTCQLSNGAAAKGAACTGDDTSAGVGTRDGDPTTARRGTREVVGAQPVADTDPAASHLPGKGVPPYGGAGTWNTTDGPVQMASCKVYSTEMTGSSGLRSRSLCTAGDGTVWSCSKTTNVLAGTCSSTAVPSDSVDCALEGYSPNTRFCTGKTGGEYHCTNTRSRDQLSCRNIDWDSDTALIGGPESCGTPDEATVVCLGSNGTLYRCRSAAAGTRDCSRSEREVDKDDPALSDCIAVGQYGDGSVQCTYTADRQQCDAGDLITCGEPGRQTSVLCHDTSGSGSGYGRYDSCQDLGGLVSPTDKREGLCLEPGTTGTCGSTAAITYTTMPRTEEEVDVGGGFEVGIGADAMTTVPDDQGNPQELDYDELELYCADHPDECGELARKRAAQVQSDAVTALEKAGVCDSVASCTTLAEEIDAPPTRGRNLQDGGYSAKRLVIGSLGISGFAFASTVGTRLIDNGTVTGKDVGAAAMNVAATLGIVYAATSALRPQDTRNVHRAVADLAIASAGLLYTRGRDGGPPRGLFGLVGNELGAVATTVGTWSAATWRNYFQSAEANAPANLPAAAGDNNV